MSADMGTDLNQGADLNTAMELPVTLENCDREPIHVPGHIQAHGVLFAFDRDKVLRYRSANARALLGDSIPALGDTLSATQFVGYENIHVLIARVLDAADDDLIPHAMEITGGQRSFDVVVHRTAAGFICEFEDSLGAVPLTHDFSFASHRAMERLKRQNTVAGLLNAAVQEVRKMTGFDRVMAYRFRHDDSGEVVAESVDAALDPFLGRRYPAGDIPAQARRLYVLNTLRLIADVRAAPVPVEVAGSTTEPLDMSYGVLRSVSPVHIEYLTNMGVQASMSVSIVIGGKLWGMIACHHMTPRRVSSKVRMACDVLAQILASYLQGALASEHVSRVDAAASMRLRIVEQVLHADDIIVALADEFQALCDAFGADGAVLSDGGRLQTFGGVSPEAGAALAQWLQTSLPATGRLLHMDSTDSLPEDLRKQMDVWCGLLLLPFGSEPVSYVLLLRKEQIETVLWGGQPEKIQKTGPLGPRLTPRGSFELWREIVRGKAVPWSETDLESAGKVLDELVRADAAHQVEISKARVRLLTMLGHDLRDPLQSILNSATLLEKSGGDGRISRHLLSSSNRMQRLINQVMDMSMLHGGGLTFNFVRKDLVLPVAHLIVETRSAYPAMNIVPMLPVQLQAEFDSDRLSQVISNLLSNANHHGLPGEPVFCEVSESRGMVKIEVSNSGQPIPPERVESLFQPFKRINTKSPTNRNGLGLGLYIAHQIMAGHGGTLTYEYADPYVIFTAMFPSSQPR